jgi:hypothetical protein
VAKEAVRKEEVNWIEYFASIVSVCPWSKSYWKQQKIDIQKWTGIENVKPLGEYVARIWIHRHASGRQLCNIHHRLNEQRQDEEWLYSHPQYGGHSTPIPVLIQQDFELLSNIRQGLNGQS